MPRLDTYLCDLKESQIRDGLHVFGESPTGRLRIDTLLALLRIPRGDGRGAQSSLLRALAKAFVLGFDPLDCVLAETWSGPRPEALLSVSDELWRTAGDTRERLELFATQLISQALSTPQSNPGPCGNEPLWRGGLPPLDCAAVPFFGAASRPNGSKLPRHKSPLPH